MDHKRLNDLNAGSIDDNTRVPEENYALTSDSWKKVRDNLERVRREIESYINGSHQSTSHNNIKQPVENTEDTPISHGRGHSYRKDDTDANQPNRETCNKDDSEPVYSTYLQCGDRNIMLICEPKNKPRKKVVYKQEGNRNIMINLRVSSNAYQLVQQLKGSQNMQVIPLDSEGEVWLEIKRRSQVESRKKFRSPGQKDSFFSGTRSSASSESDNLHYDTHKLRYRRDVDEHSFHSDAHGKNAESESRSIEENAYVLNTQETVEWKDSQYEILSISEDRDLLKMRFSKKRAGKQEGLERLILSHQKVCDFLRDSSNAFNASLCDWMYESDEDIYDYIKGQIPPGYSPGVEEVNPEDDVQIVKWTQKENEAVYEWTRNKDIEKPPHQRALHSVHCSPSCIVPTVPVRKQPPSEDPGFGTSPHPSRRDRIQDWEWYRDELTDEKAKWELENKPPGTFLVRKTAPKTAEPDGSLHVFTLEFVIEHSRTKKLMIMKTGDVYHFKESRQQGQETQTFKTVSDLVAKVLAIGLEIKDPRTNLWTTFQVKPVWHKQ